MAPEILVVGSSNVDFIMRVGKLPAKGETVTNGEFRQTFGGKGANQAVAAARAGGRVTFVTGLGDDVYASIMVENFRRDGMITDRIVFAPGTACGSALVMFDRQGDNYLTVAPGSNYSVTPEVVARCEDAIAGAAMVILQMELPPESVRCTLELAARHGVPTMLNYAPVQNLDVPLSSAISILVVNEHEASDLAGLPVTNRGEAARAAAALRERGPNTVVVTLGAAGAVALDHSGESFSPAFRVTPIDTTAAGDVYCGALAVAVTERRPLAEAMAFASAASAISVTAPGAQPSIPKRDQIEAFLCERSTAP